MIIKNITDSQSGKILPVSCMFLTGQVQAYTYFTTDKYEIHLLTLAKFSTFPALLVQQHYIFWNLPSTFVFVVWPQNRDFINPKFNSNHSYWYVVKSQVEFPFEKKSKQWMLHSWSTLFCNMNPEYLSFSSKSSIAGH